MGGTLRFWGGNPPQNRKLRNPRGGLFPPGDSPPEQGGLLGVWGGARGDSYFQKIIYSPPEWGGLLEGLGGTGILRHLDRVGDTSDPKNDTGCKNRCCCYFFGANLSSKSLKNRPAAGSTTIQDRYHLLDCGEQTNTIHN